MSQVNLNFDLMIWHTAFVTSEAIERNFEKNIINLNTRQYALMGFLYLGHELIQQDLAKILKKDKSAVLRSIDLLQERDLVVRLPHSTDRRKKKLQLTQAGVDLYKQANTIAQNVIDQLLTGLNQEEISIFKKVALHLEGKSCCNFYREK